MKLRFTVTRLRRLRRCRRRWFGWLRWLWLLWLVLFVVCCLLLVVCCSFWWGVACFFVPFRIRGTILCAFRPITGHIFEWLGGMGLGGVGWGWYYTCPLLRHMIFTCVRFKATRFSFAFDATPHDFYVPFDSTLHDAAKHVHIDAMSAKFNCSTPGMEPILNAVVAFTKARVNTLGHAPGMF